MKSFSDEPWKGESKIILGIDLGTTHSAVSFAYLYQGDRQVVRRVTKWPGQEAHKDHSKIPTLVYYDKDNEAKKRDQAEEEGWSLAKYFKLHLHPQSMRSQDRLTLYPLPFGVSLSKVYTDFLGYLLRHTHTFFEEHIIDGPQIWKTCASNILIVMAHPNGWATREQNFMRQALMDVGPEYKNYQVTFVTEGEASVHFCMFNSNMESALEPHTDLIVCDAGGSTVDTTAYVVESTSPMLELRERKASACIQAGGVFVDIECEKYLTKLLSVAHLDEEDIREYLGNGLRDFEAGAKQEFGSADGAHYINFNDSRFSKETIGIKRGRMSLKGSIIETFFEGVVSSTITSLKQQMQGLSPKHLLLVGGFGESKYLRRRLNQEFSKDGCRVAIVDDSTSKAAADGSVIWAAKLSVVGRVTRTSYGTTVRTRYDPLNPDHLGRKFSRGNGGYQGVTGKWSEIVAEGVTLSAQESARRKFLKSYKPGRSSYSDLEKYTDEIWVYYGQPGTNPGWIEDKDGNINPGFEKLCTVEANLAGMRDALIRKVGADGTYEVLEFWLAIQAGGTELCARIEWIENGVQKSGPVTIMPEPVDPLPSGGNMTG
ncbi:ATP binding, partial [Rhizoctonia solani]